MAILDGQRVRAQESNAAWASKTADNTMVGVQNLQNPSSGADVNNVQQEINDIKQDVAVNTNDIANLDTVKQDLIEKGQANGYASLDALGKVPLSEIPDEIVGGMKFQGLWDASTNTPTLADGVGDPGDVYQASVAGTVDFGSGNIVFTVGDFAIYSGTVWQKIEGGLVESVNGNVGVVVLDTDDIPEGALNEYYTDAKADARADARIAAASIDDLSDVDLTVPPVDGQALVFQSGSWIAGAGSGGSGEGRVNFIENGNFEIDAADWIESDNTKLSIAFSSSSPLVGAGSGLITKLAVDASGAIVSKVSKPIDIAYRGKPLFVMVKYDLSHANYVSGDLRLQVYDSTNAALLNVFPVANLDGNNGFLKGAATALAVCYPPDTCAEVVFRTTVVTDNATAATWNGKIDDVLVGPDSAIPTNRVIGATSFTPTGSWVSNTTYSGRKWSVGDRNFYQVFVSLSGSPGAGALTINLPDTIDTAKLPNSGADVLLGTCIFRDVVGTLPDTRRMQGGVEFLTSTSVRPHIVLVDQSNNHYQRTINNVSLTIGAGIVISMEFSVPIVNQATGNLMSSFEASLQTVKARVERASTAQSLADAVNTSVQFNSVIEDKFSMWDAANFRFVMPKDGWVVATAGANFASNGTGRRWILIARSGVSQARQYQPANVGDNSMLTAASIFKVQKGQFVSAEAYQNSGGALNLNAAIDTFLSVAYLPDFSVFGAYSEAGKFLSSTNVGNVNYTNSSWRDVTSLTLSPGEWVLSAQIHAECFGATGGVVPTASCISDFASTGSTPADFVQGLNSSVASFPNASSWFTQHVVVAYKVTVSQTKTFYLQEWVNAATNLRRNSYKLTAERIK